MPAERAKLVLFMVAAVAGATLVATSAHAQATDLQNASGSYQGLLDLIQSNAANWSTKLREYATRLFWILAAIQLVWTFFPLVLKQADFGEIVGELVRFIMVIGFFYALLLYSTVWAGDIVDSFRQAGASAAGVGKGLQPGDMFGLAVDMALTVTNGATSTWNPFAGAAIAVAGAIVLLAFAFIAAFMAVTLVESYVVINASVLFMGFGGSQWTREYALAMARYAVAVGAKLFVLTLLVGIIVSSAHQWEAAYHNDRASMWTMVGLALVCAYLAKQIPDLVQSLITGTSTGGGHALGGFAAAAAAGAAAGIAAATTGGASAIASGAANALGGAGGGMGGGGGLAAAINSSLSGAGNAASSAASGGSSGASSIAPRIGGAPSTGGARPSASSSAGRGTMGGAAPGQGTRGPATATGGPQSGAKAPQGGSSASNGAGQGTATPAAQNGSTGASGGGGGQEPGQTPASPSGESAAPAASGGGAGRAAHMAAAGLVRSAGILSAISVPGMEHAAGMSIGPHPSMFGGQGSNATGDQSGDFAASDSPDTDNTIRPASAPQEPPAPPSSPGTPPAPPTDNGDKA